MQKRIESTLGIINKIIGSAWLPVQLNALAERTGDQRTLKLPYLNQLANHAQPLLINLPETTPSVTVERSDEKLNHNASK